VTDKSIKYIFIAIKEAVNVNQVPLVDKFLQQGITPYFLFHGVGALPGFKTTIFPIS
jgi:hypothetical protein